MLKNCAEKVDALQKYFLINDYQVSNLCTDLDFLQQLSQESFELISLVEHEPDMCGFNALKHLCQMLKIKCPALPPANQGGEYDVVQAINLVTDGVTQKLWKPFKQRSQVNTSFKRRHSVPINMVSASTIFKFNMHTSQAWRHNNPLNFTLRDFYCYFVFKKS